jgi:glycosidase
VAKSSHVWLEQLARAHTRPVATLADVPDAELDRLAAFGVTGLWLIGLWQRSRASAEIKRRRGDTGAVASAYSIDEYRIADDLGGEAAFESLRERAAARGIRLAADMVPNHTGIDAPWVLERPDAFISVAESPFPAYTFEGPDLSPDPRVEIALEDHYWDGTDAAVVFRWRDRASGETRFIYHGNDGTSFPWNDTAQLDYLQAAVREAVIRTILDVARRAPIVRFDAAMVLTRRHIRRLWYPEPGSGGAIPSRAEHAMSRAEFDLAMPHEFWREVVDRVAAEAPGTLLLAEAFWLLEGYFVRTLGMHRVYNSAFMHMIRDENNAGYRRIMRETLAFDPGVLGRFVNFMTNPDERPAAEQFGTGDKAFAAMTLLATMPGLWLELGPYD